jgi:hypothetical protein
MPEKYLLYNKKLGFYQGSLKNIGFWSKLENCSDYAIAFNNIEEIEKYIMFSFYSELELYGDIVAKKPYYFLYYPVNNCNSNYVSLSLINGQLQI